MRKKVWGTLSINHKEPKHKMFHLAREGHGITYRRGGEGGLLRSPPSLPVKPWQDDQHGIHPV